MCFCCLWAWLHGCHPLALTRYYTISRGGKSTGKNGKVQNFKIFISREAATARSSCCVEGIRRFRRLPQICFCCVPLLRICPTRRRDGAKLLLRGRYPQISQITADLPLLRVGITRRREALTLTLNLISRTAAEACRSPVEKGHRRWRATRRGAARGQRLTAPLGTKRPGPPLT